MKRESCGREKPQETPTYPPLVAGDFVEVSGHASWNGLAVVYCEREHGTAMISVMPMFGKWKGVVGAFPRKDLTLVHGYIYINRPPGQPNYCRIVV